MNFLDKYDEWLHLWEQRNVERAAADTSFRDYNQEMWKTYIQGAVAFNDGTAFDHNPMTGPGHHFGAYACWSRGWRDAKKSREAPAPTPIKTERRMIFKKRGELK